ncbi:hypothetical protein B6U93_02425 [Candidatus Woesearchaeota archaeon ex4484_78]|nr:MAG: hypothetical protein B6U93_02425 [Candidatus Woesearchaeota archaeon ex4484_78]
MIQTQQINQLFQEKEKQIKQQIIKEALKEVEKAAEREIKLFEFELFYSLLLKNKKTNEWVQEKRKKDWEKTLKKANNDYAKAMVIFAS